MHSFLKIPLLLFIFALAGLQLRAADPMRGLWVGEVSLTAVNEATGAVGDSNTYEFTDPEITTPTSDTAYLRLIVHVNGAGQVSLLKSVVIVDRNADDPGALPDILLITDPLLYPQYPGVAKRIATAAFDFGDQQAINAVQSLIDEATALAVSGALAGDDQSQIEADINAALGTVVDSADVDNAYLNTGTSATSFVTDNFFTYADIVDLADAVADLLDSGTKTAADFIYDASAPPFDPFAGAAFAVTFNNAFAAAEALRDASFYGDTRGIQAIVNVLDAAVGAVVATDAGAAIEIKTAHALAAAEAAWHNAGDLDQVYNRFLASDAFSNLPAALIEVTVPAAIDAEALGGDATAISTAVRDALLLNGTVSAANSAAEAVALASVFSEDDPRATRTMETMIDTTVSVATAQVQIDSSLSAMTDAVTTAVNLAFDSIPASPVFAASPSAQYSEYVSGTAYASAATQAATTAAAEATFQKNAGEDDEARLSFIVKREVSKALVATRNDVAALPQDTVPMSGKLEEGSFVEGRLYLPALAPTNPFMHRLHPDHPEGFPIIREIQFEVDSSVGGEFGLNGSGVSRISGIYREEITGLHKPLGPNQDIGLKTEGIFTLNRLSLVDALNF